MEMCQYVEIRKNKDYLEDCEKFCAQELGGFVSFLSSHFALIYSVSQLELRLWDVLPDICLRLGLPMRGSGHTLQTRRQEEAGAFLLASLVYAVPLAVVMSPGQLLPGKSGPWSPSSPGILHLLIPELPPHHTLLSFLTLLFPV